MQMFSFSGGVDSLETAGGKLDGIQAVQYQRMASLRVGLFCFFLFISQSSLLFTFLMI